MTTKGNEGQSALVTGASGGIGLELARVLAANRFSLVLLARSRDKREDLARDLAAQHGTKVTIVPADLSEPGAAQAVFDSLTDAGVQIDLLVNNAGLLLEGRFGAIGLDGQLRLLQVNIIALTALTRLFLGPMLERNCGRILKVASVAAFMPVPNLAVCAASKAYVLSFGDALSQEFSGTKIAVTTLCPGVTDTGMVHGTSLGGLPAWTQRPLPKKGIAPAWRVSRSMSRELQTSLRSNGSSISLGGWLMRAFGSVLGKGRDA